MQNYLHDSKKSSTFAIVFGLAENLRDVAQPGSATVWGTGGRKFKSCHPDNKSTFRGAFVVVGTQLPAQ